MKVSDKAIGSDSQLSIIKALYFNGLMTCAEISQVTEASIPNVFKNVTALIEAGFVEEKGLAESKVGRKPLTYSLVADKKYVVVVAQDQFYTRMAITDLHNNFATDIYEYEIDLKQANAVEKLVTYIKDLISSAGIEKHKICCAGISMPGFVDIVKGVNHTFMKVESQSLREYLTEHIGLPVCIDNDSSAIALAELKFGAGRKTKETMVINLGWGVGLGLIVHGKIFRGFNGFAGEFSHIPIFKNNKRCSCGKIGCLETEASLIIMENRALEGIKSGQHTDIQLAAPDKVSILSIFKAAAAGDSFAIKLISETAYHIGQGIAILIHILNPELVILSGKGIIGGKLWLPPIEQALNDLCIPTLTEGIAVGITSLGKNAQLIGSGALAIDNIDFEYLLN